MDEFKEELRLKQEARAAKDLNLLSMIESRIMEIIQIEDECKKKLPKLYNQRLPRFMRRRAACHNTKRLPTRLRSKVKTDYGSKSRKNLVKYRRRLMFRKRKRVLKKHGLHKFHDPDKSLLHKWFAKRFKMGSRPPLMHVPIHNSTKNQRNLYRQTRYGCCYLSLAHLSAIKISLTSISDRTNLLLQLEQLNNLTLQTSGFTFQARALESSNYEVAIHLYRPAMFKKEYICPALVSLDRPLFDTTATTSGPLNLTLWVPKEFRQEISDLLESLAKTYELAMTVSMVPPRDIFRVKLLGPTARDEAARLSADPDKHKLICQDVDAKIYPSVGSSIGRIVQEQHSSFVYYNTNPCSLDIILRHREGRMVWHKLIKNRAHLVGAHRDISRLLVRDCFKLTPDC